MNNLPLVPSKRSLLSLFLELDDDDLPLLPLLLSSLEEDVAAEEVFLDPFFPSDLCFEP